MESIPIGEITALIASCLWAMNSLLFTEAGRRIGSLSVNAYRIIMAAGFQGVIHIIVLRRIVPVASTEQWLWMGLSGIVGLGIGDFGLFAAYVQIGPRLTTLIMTLSPIFASLGALILLGEVISPITILGIGITLAGVITVVLEREKNAIENSASNKHKMRGVYLALVGALGQGMGLTLAKKGIILEPNSLLNPLSATLIRMMFGTVFVWTVILFSGKLGELRKALSNRKGVKYTAAGAFIGPFAGVTLSMVAIAYTQAGIAQTLLSLMPIFVLPMLWIFYKYRTSWRGVLGACTAVVGVAVLLLT